ncbi:MAG: hypothetical protein ABSE77_08695 [Acidimicrobiales bacterium]
MRERVTDALSSIDLPQSRARDAGRALASKRRFADGSAWRVEIPSVEGPEAMMAVMAESAARAVPVHRVSQGSGTALLTEAELGEMAELGRARTRTVRSISAAGPALRRQGAEPRALDLKKPVHHLA